MDMIRYSCALVAVGALLAAARVHSCASLTADRVQSCALLAADRVQSCAPRPWGVRIADGCGRFGKGAEGVTWHESAQGAVASIAGRRGNASGAVRTRFILLHRCRPKDPSYLVGHGDADGKGTGTAMWWDDERQAQAGQRR